MQQPKNKHSTNQVQTLNEAVCIAYNANTFRNGMNLTILPLAMNK